MLLSQEKLIWLPNEQHTLVRCLSGRKCIFQAKLPRTVQMEDNINWVWSYPIGTANNWVPVVPAQPKASTTFQCAALPRAAADAAKPQGILHLLGKTQSHEDRDTHKQLQHFTIWNTGAEKSWNPFCFTIAVNCTDAAWLDTMSSNAQMSPCVLGFFHPFLWQTVQDERLVLAFLYPRTGLWWLCIITTTEHKPNTQTDPQAKRHFRFFKCWLKRHTFLYWDNYKQTETELFTSSAGYYLFGNKLKQNFKILKISKANSLTENVTVEHLHKSLVHCALAAVHKNKFTEKSQMSAKVTWKLTATETHRASPPSTQIYPISSSMCAHWTLGWAKSTPKSCKKTQPGLLSSSWERQGDSKVCFLPRWSPGWALSQQAPEPSQDTRGNWSCNTYIDKGYCSKEEKKKNS